MQGKAAVQIMGDWARGEFAVAGKEAKEMSHSYVGTEHLLLGILRDDVGLASKILKKLDIDIKSCRNEILAEIDPNFEPEDLESAFAGSESESSTKSTSKTPADRDTPALISA